HIAAASRLRWNLSTPADKAQPFDTAEAILEPDGKPVHLTHTTTSTAAQERLRRATRLMDKARGSLRRTAPLEALDLWEGLVAGHWSLIEHIDTDGRRFILAKKNAPHVVDPRQLTLRERQVVNFVVQGHHNKLIAYELGLGTSTVGHHLNKALRKLGFQSRAELITFFQQLASMPSRPAS
ncbi:MAG: helix-turn-helix transcriptional regulator, partial [Myxococcota bacterium]